VSEDTASKYLSLASFDSGEQFFSLPSNSFRPLLKIDHEGFERINLFTGEYFEGLADQVDSGTLVDAVAQYSHHTFFE
jgi:hypothetical protein